MKRILFFAGLALMLLTVSGCMQFGLPTGLGGPQTYSASGRIADAAGLGIAGVTIALSGGATVTTDSDGKWTATGLSGSVTLSPQKTGYTFTPASRTVTQASSALDFTGTISASPQTYAAWVTIDDRSQQGSVPAGTVTLTLSNGTTTTTTMRAAEIDGLSGSVTVTPSLAGHAFIPPTQTLSPDHTSAAFTEVLPATGALHGRLVFSDVYNKGVYIVGDDGSGLVALKAYSGNSGEYASSPALAPDGRTVVFSPGTPDGALQEMGVDGSNVTPFTQDAYYAAPDPAWTRDGTKIVFTTTVKVQDDALAVVPDTGGSVQTIIPDDPKIFQLLEPDWSPDGSRLVFAADYNGGEPGIFVMNADGTQALELRRDAQTEPQPHWSPDGTQIAFLAPPAGGLGAHIYIMDATGQNAVDIMPTSADNVTAVCWSPDGNRLAYAAGRAIYAIDRDGGNRTLIATVADTFGAARLSWGPLG